jgi:predicted nucleic-acid-binding Zn-ribbon protein
MTFRLKCRNRHYFEGLILAQGERWRCALSMQVERDSCVAQGNSKYEYRNSRQYQNFNLLNSKVYILEVL